MIDVRTHTVTCRPTLRFLGVRKLVATASLLSLLSASTAWAASPLAEPTPDGAGEAAVAEPAPVAEPTAAPDSGPISASAWNALLERDVVLLRRDGSTVSGRLVGVDEQTATVVIADGRVVTTGKAEVTEVRAQVAAPPPAVAATTPAAAGPVPPAAPQGDRSVTNWARAGAGVGLGLGAVAFALAIGAEVTRDEQIPSLPLGSVATILFATSVPVTMAGGKSARRHASVKGNVGLRIGGWVLYGLTLLDAAVLVGLGANEVDVPPGVITSVGVLGLGSISLAAADALVSDKQARGTFVARQPQRYRLFAAPTRAPGGRRMAGGVFGVSGAF